MLNKHFLVKWYHLKTKVKYLNFCIYLSHAEI